MYMRSLIPRTQEEEDDQLGLALALSLEEFHLPPPEGFTPTHDVVYAIAGDLPLVDDLPRVDDDNSPSSSSSSSSSPPPPVEEEAGTSTREQQQRERAHTEELFSQFDGKARSNMPWHRGANGCFTNPNQRRRTVSCREPTTKQQEPVCCGLRKKLVKQKTQIFDEDFDQSIRNPLHVAIDEEHLQCLEALLKGFPRQLNSVNSQGETALFYAAFEGNVEAVKLLLSKNANVNKAKCSFETPIYAAIIANNTEILMELIRAGATINMKANRGWTPLHEAVYRGLPHILQILISRGGEPNMRDSFGASPIFTAATVGRNECLRVLIKADGDINLQTKSKRASPLFEASKEGHIDCVDTLLAYGADPHTDNCDGILPIHIACSNGHENIVEKLLRITDLNKAEACGVSPLHFATNNDHIEVMEMLIQKGYDVNHKLIPDKILYMERRQSALFFAVSNCSEEAIDLLLNAGAKTDLDRFKALWVAINHCEYDLTEQLLFYGADVNAPFDEAGIYYPASVAFAIRDITMLNIVAKAGADVEKCFHCEMGCEDHNNFNLDTRRKSFCNFLTNEEQYRDWTGAAIRFLLNFVGNVTLCRKLRENIHDTDEWEEIMKIIEKPRSLTHICRLKIRETLGHHHRLIDNKSVTKLPLPPLLLQYMDYSLV